MELTGKIIAVMEPRGGVSARTGNTWKTQEYVLEVPGQYPKRCLFNVFGEFSLISMLVSTTVVGSTISVLTM